MLYLPDPWTDVRVLFMQCRYRLPSGEQAVVSREMASLSAAGHEVDVLDFDNSAGVVATGAALTVAAWNPRSASTALEAVRRFRPDVVHLHNTWFAASPSVPAAVRRSGVPMVTTLHNYRFTCVSGALFRDGQVCRECLDGSAVAAVRHRCYRDSALLSASAAVAERVSATQRARGAEIFIAPSNFVARTAVEAGFDSSRLVVLPHGAPDPGPRPEPPSRSTSVVFVGRMAEGKGVECLLRAWARADTGELTLDLIGDGPDFDRVRTELPEGVRALGWRDSSEVAARMAEARAIVVPSEWHEPFGLVLIEALASGLPVVAFDTSSVADILGEGAVAVPAPGDAPLASALELLLDDERMDRVGAAARRRYEERYLPELHLAGLLEIYRAAIDGN